VASVEIARLAREDLHELINTRSLPADTEERIWRSLLQDARSATSVTASGD